MRAHRHRTTTSPAASEPGRPAGPRCTAAGIAAVLAAALVVGPPALVLAGPVAASSKHKAGPATVKLANVAGVGQVLVNSAGQTLYLFEPDHRKQPTCAGACATAWPPLTVAGKPVAGSGLKKSLLGVDMDADGQHQVTYNRWPLYTFAGDDGPGHANGQGVDAFGGKWWTVDATGTAMGATASSAPSGSGASSGSSTSGSEMTSTASGGRNGY